MTKQKAIANVKMLGVFPVFSILKPPTYDRDGVTVGYRNYLAHEGGDLGKSGDG
jgi:hypothetical protein